MANSLSADDVRQILDSPQTVTKETVRALVSELQLEYRNALEEIGVDKITRELNSGIDTEAKKNYLTVFQYQHLQKVEEERNQQVVLLNLIMNAKGIKRQIDQEIKNNQDPSLLIGLEQDKQIAENLLAELIKNQQKQALLLKLSDAIARESVLLQKRADLEERRIDEFLKDNPELNKATPELSRKAAMESIHQRDKEFHATKNHLEQIKILGKYKSNDSNINPHTIEDIKLAMNLENQAAVKKNEISSLERTLSISYKPNMKNDEKQQYIAEKLNNIQKKIPPMEHASKKLEARYPHPTFGQQKWIEENTEERNIINHGNSRKFSPTPQRH